MLPLNSIRFALAAALVGASAASALAATNNSDDSNSIKQVVIYSAAPDYVSGTMLVSGANFGTSASFVGIWRNTSLVCWSTTLMMTSLVSVSTENSKP